LFSLSNVLKNTEVAELFWLFFFHGASYALILIKKGWARVWASFSQTHLVTLA
jgi:endonuclease YncB( thermonuclease family)